MSISSSFTTRLSRRSFLHIQKHQSCIGKSVLDRTRLILDRRNQLYSCSIPVGADGSNSQSITVQQNGVTFTATGTDGSRLAHTGTKCYVYPHDVSSTSTTPTYSNAARSSATTTTLPHPVHPRHQWCAVGSIAIAVLVLFIILIVVMIHRRKSITWCVFLPGKEKMITPSLKEHN